MTKLSTREVIAAAAFDNGWQADVRQGQFDTYRRADETVSIMYTLRGAVGSAEHVRGDDVLERVTSGRYKFEQVIDWLCITEKKD